MLWASLRDEPSRVFYDLAMVAFRIITDIFAEAEAKGLENIPLQGGAILAPNHLSYFDPIVLGGILDMSGRNTHALAKSELFTVPLLGRFLRALGQVPVYRGTPQASKALMDAELLLKAGHLVAIYPEGTISPDGMLLPFKTGPVRLALSTGSPLIPIAQEGANQVIRSDVTQRVATALKAIVGQPTIRVLIGEPLHLQGDPNSKEDVKLATKELEETMRTLLLRLPREEWTVEESFPASLHRKWDKLQTTFSTAPSTIKLRFASWRALLS